MTEVWEEKFRPGSGDAHGKADSASGSEKNTRKMNNDEKAGMDERTCHLCGRVFKDYRARETHERHCSSKSKDKGKGGQEESRLRAAKAPTEKGLDEAGIGGLGSAGVVVLDEKEDMGPREGIEEVEELEEMEEELGKLEPDLFRTKEGVSKEELEALSLELAALETELNSKVDFTALAKMSDEHDESIMEIQKSIDTLYQKTTDIIRNMKVGGRRAGTDEKMVREMKKLDDKTTEILEEIGFGESLNVSKIPPKILESVYESTMDELINEMRRNHGSTDAENIITSSLEDIRTRTSGSELFYFDGRKLRTRNLAKAVSERLISAKQVQTTYDELLRKLLEYLPGYKPKNFRAMIKLKSQEYAVDKTTLLLDGFGVVKEEMNNLKNMVASVSNRQNTIDMTINSLIESKVERGDIEKIQALIEEIKGKQGDLDGLLREVKDQMEKDKKVFLGKIEGMSKRMKGFEETVSRERKKGKASGPEKRRTKGGDRKKTRRKGEDELTEDELRIHSLIPSKGFTLSRIKKEIDGDMEEERIEECLQSMMNKGVVSTVKRGKHTIYVRNKK